MFSLSTQFVFGDVPGKFSMENFKGFLISRKKFPRKWGFTE
jgi:hypothetical protein